VHNENLIQNSTAVVIVRRMLKLTCFFAVVFLLFFCIAWQNIYMYSMNKKINDKTQLHNELEKSIYLKNIELSKLESRERIKKIALDGLGMVPVTYRDVKIIVY